jgi:hypothetical protein
MVNIRRLKKSTKKLLSGDIFALQVQEGQYIFGRVIRLDAKVGGFDDCILIYIYRTFSEDKNKIPKLDKNNLLIPPIATNLIPWTHGYFEVISHSVLNEDDIHKPHCFWDFCDKCYFDDNNNKLPQRIEPCGKYALCSIYSIDADISKSLGIPFTLDEDETPFSCSLGIQFLSKDFNLDGRDDVELALEKALLEKKLDGEAEITGGGCGTESVDIEIDIKNKSKAREVLKTVRNCLKEINSPKSTVIWFYGSKKNVYEK